MGSRNEVKILKGGYEEFSALYPFLRTQKILFTPRELDEIKPYPLEIIQGLLYMGDWRQGNAPYIQKDLKIRAHINCCVEEETFVCDFIEKYFEEQFAVLVYDYRGVSRATTVVLAFLMHHYNWTLAEAYSHVLKCCPKMRPNRGFIEQLSQWEEQVLGAKTTDISDPNY
ncbi:serine/threonine/tyrosine-interacting-like protein 1 [Plakobranchus ocellatus]|uniref:Serine/threonine/tyrosine-interacting-like protein 1 n=1 Tax=Plakobranchus ocellatus TaxID=259542 RepID=A0AAV4CVK1_9GAST|nr:serine/threonine/tyrosine-interacting-like protein 1 [Plakobranchus ocellatus]